MELYWFVNRNQGSDTSEETPEETLAKDQNTAVQDKRLIVYRNDITIRQDITIRKRDSWKMYCHDMELSQGQCAAWCKIRSVLNPRLAPYPTLVSSDGGIKTRSVTTTEKLETFASQLEGALPTKSMDYLTLFNSDHRIILICTKSVRVLFERKESNRLKPQDVTYNDQVIPSSSSVKFLCITFDSALTLRPHFRTVATLARHRLPKLNSIFSSTYGPSTSTSTLIRLYKTYIRSLFD